MENKEDLIKILKQKGLDDTIIKNLLENASKGDKQAQELLTTTLLTDSIGRVSEEKVYKKDGDKEEIKLSSIESDSKIVNGEVQEKRRETSYGSLGNVTEPIFCVDKHKHSLSRSQAMTCNVCLRYGCVLDCFIGMDIFGFITMAVHKECLQCSSCGRPSNEPETLEDMYIVKDDNGNLIQCKHRECKLSAKIMKWIFEPKPIKQDNKYIEGFNSK